MEKTYNYVFHYNHYTGLWNAIPREKYQDYFSKKHVPGVLKSSEMPTLIELINKGEDFIKRVPTEKK